MRFTSGAALSAGRSCGGERGTGRRFGFVLIAVLALLALAACGSDDDAAEPASQAPSVPPPPESITGSEGTGASDPRSRQAREQDGKARRERDRREAREERRRGSDRPDAGASSAGAPQGEVGSERGTDADLVWRGRLHGRRAEIRRVPPGSSQCEITLRGKGAGNEATGRIPCDQVRDLIEP